MFYVEYCTNNMKYTYITVSQHFLYMYMYSQICLFQTPWDPKKTVLIIEVSLFHRFIYTHLYCNGTETDYFCIEVSLFQSVHNNRFDCTCTTCIMALIFLIRPLQLVEDVHSRAVNCTCFITVFV